MAGTIEEVLVEEEEVLVEADQIDEKGLEVLALATTIHPAIQIEEETASGINQKEQVDLTIGDHLADRKDPETDLKVLLADTMITQDLHQE